MRQRIVWCLAALLALFVLGDTIAVLCLQHGVGQLTALADSHRIQVNRAELASSAARIEADALSLRVGKERAAERLVDTLHRFDGSVAACNGCHHGAAIQDELDELQSVFHDYRRITELLLAQTDPQEMARLHGEASRQAGRLVQQATAMADLATRHLRIRSSEAADHVQMAKTVLVGTLVGTLIMGCVVALHLKRRLTRPIESLLEGVARLQHGERAPEMPARADEEFRALARAFNEACENLRNAQEGVLRAEKMAAVGKLAAGVAHEVGNPLASMSSVVQMMRRDGLPPLQAERVDLIMEQIGRITRIVHELLTFARPGVQPKLGRVRIDALLEQAITLLRYDKRAKDIRIVCDVDGDLPEIRGDSDKLLLVFTNIMINAFDALTAQRNGPPVLSISAHGHEGGIVLEFTDNGPGMSREQVASAFEPFFTTKEPGAGTGLGLWICYQVIGKHHGTIGLDSAPGEGVTVRIRFYGERFADSADSGTPVLASSSRPKSTNGRSSRRTA